MSEKTKVFRVVGFSDVNLTKEESERASGYAILHDRDGKVIAEVETYGVGYETEDGDECEEDGTLLGG